MYRVFMVRLNNFDGFFPAHRGRRFTRIYDSVTVYHWISLGIPFFLSPTAVISSKLCSETTGVYLKTNCRYLKSPAPANVPAKYTRNARRSALPAIVFCMKITAHTSPSYSRSLGLGKSHMTRIFWHAPMSSLQSYFSFQSNPYSFI